MHHYTPPIAGKEFPPQPYPGDIHDRRLPGVSPNAYQSDYPDDYAMTGAISIPYTPSQQFLDRLGRFPSERYSHQPVSNVLPHIHSNHPTTDIMRSAVPPPVTSSFRDNNISPYNEMQYLGNSEMRMHAVDETLSRMKLQGNPMMGPASDLHTFIRYANCFPVMDHHLSLLAAPSSTNISVLLIG
jgi:hypothetical protein